MVKKVSIPIYLLIVLYCQCAYFNIFYNAEHYYKKAYNETKKNRTDKVTGSEKSNYQKAVEKSQKLIEYYPKSKYVDDALLLMGKSYYYQHDYLKAERRLYELVQEYPNSTLLPNAMLYLAKTHLALEEFEQAEDEFKKLSKTQLSKMLMGETFFYLGKLYEREGAFEKAIDAYQRVIQYGSEALKAETYFTLGLGYDTLGVYDKASEAFQKVQKYNPTSELLFESQLRYAQAQKKDGKIDTAIHILEGLLGTETDKNRIPVLRLEIAECLALREDIDGAIIAYQDVAKDYPKTAHSAKAYYALGKLYATKRNDYDRALEQYNQVKKEYSRFEFADSADVKARDIMRMQALEYVIRMAKTGESGDVVVVEPERAEEDTLSVDYVYSAMDTISNDSLRNIFLTKLWGKAFVDSILTDPEVFKQQREMERQYQLDDKEEDEKESLVNWAQWIREGIMPSYSDLEQEIVDLKEKFKKRDKVGLAENPELKSFKIEEVDKNRFLLSELYWFRFNLIDSAMNQYQRIIVDCPESVYAPRALYNLGYLSGHIYCDSTSMDSLYRQLISRYPHSLFTNAAREHLGIPLLYTQEDSVKMLFEEAEKLLLHQNKPKTAYRVYQSVWHDYPGSEWAAKALYSMGWIYEHQFDSLNQAIVLYDSLMQNYPESVYAKTVQPKVLAVKSAREKKKKAESGEQAERDHKEEIVLKKPIVSGTESDTLGVDTTRVDLTEKEITADTVSVEKVLKNSAVQESIKQPENKIDPDKDIQKEESKQNSEPKKQIPEDLMLD